MAIMSVFLPALYVLHVVRSAIQGMGNAMLPMTSGVVEFFMCTGTALCLPLAVGEVGIFLLNLRLGLECMWCWWSVTSL